MVEARDWPVTVPEAPLHEHSVVVVAAGVVAVVVVVVVDAVLVDVQPQFYFDTMSWLLRVVVFVLHCYGPYALLQNHRAF